MNIQLLAMDLDGTSLQANHESFTPRLHRALADAHARGVAIVPITGRPLFQLPPPVRTGAPWENLCVLCNGGETRRIATGELLRGYYLSPQVCLAVIDLARRFDVSVELSDQSHIYLTRESWDRSLRYPQYIAYHLSTVLPRQGMVVDRLEDTACTPGIQVAKINLPHIPEPIHDAFDAELDKLPLTYTWSGPCNIEITHQMSTKGNGLVDVCQRLGIDPTHAMAMGDSNNDVSMLQAAGFAVAMGNATPAVQALADAVTLPYDQDGAAVAIERYILNQ